MSPRLALLLLRMLEVPLDLAGSVVDGNTEVPWPNKASLQAVFSDLMYTRGLRSSHSSRMMCTEVKGVIAAVLMYVKRTWCLKEGHGLR